MSNNNIRAFFFDLDGTLMDTEVLYVEAVKSALAEKNCLLTQEEATELVYGKSWRDVYADSCQRFPNAYPTIDSMKEVIYKYFSRLRGLRDICILTSIELLKILSKNHPVAIVSGSSRKDIEESLAIMKIENNIRFFLGSEDYFPGKPDPICYRMAAEQIGHLPAQCLVFEDSSAGVRAAKAAGMKCVALKRNSTLEQDVSPADLVLSDLADFSLEKV